MIAPGELTVHTLADATGTTRIAQLRQRYPQRVTTALHTDADYPRAAVLCVQSPSGGTFSDDDLQTTVHCAGGTHLYLTSQAATQVFAGTGPGARHRLRFAVDAGAVLEYLPKTIIPQSDSTFTQSIELDVDEGGTYIGWDAIAAGRIAHGERFRYAGVDNSFTVRVGGRVIARDRQLITAEAGLDSDYLATLLIVTPGRSPAPALSTVRATLGRFPGVLGGAGELPHRAGVFARLTARRAPELNKVCRALHAAARHSVLSPPIARSA
ncbi:urease accessory protein ureD [Mycobacterium sp. Root265]|uniref:urease accessory protein UreD n=1 Tax=Mycobacterium sp. Root265 TaxID=1736504 RepID=UPI00070A3F6D|nr:urease accessory protein UreD [Mycobacterium sp. Root265]KRD09800.1 urease accessory protein ureD [Mycobacterium sp. Root265]